MPERGNAESLSSSSPTNDAVEPTASSTSAIIVESDVPAIATAVPVAYACDVSDDDDDEYDDDSANGNEDDVNDDDEYCDELLGSPGG